MDCTDDECVNWREYVATAWPGETLNPLRRDYRGKESQFVNSIVALDKVDIARSDCVLVNLSKNSAGTSMEIYYAFSTGKLVVIVSPIGYKLSPWIIYHSHMITDSYATAFAFIREQLW